MRMATSPFLEIPAQNWIASNDQAFAVFDGFPVSVGHSLVITRRIVPTWFEATADEQSALMDLVNVVKQKLDETLRPKPDGYNVGFNAGDAAGQTVPHLHIHVIPRYAGDVDDPRGGVRHVIPGKGNYLKEAAGEPAGGAGRSAPTLSVGYPHSPLWEQLSWRIAGAHAVDVLASFVQSSGLAVIEEQLFEALRAGAQVRILVSDYLYISAPKALRTLVGWCDLASEDFDNAPLQVRLIETAKLPTRPESFHPKAWRIVEGPRDFISVGSSNLSKAALVSGVEWNLLSTSTASEPSHLQFSEEFQTLWQVASPLTPELVESYAKLAAQYRQEHFLPEADDVQEIPEPRPWQVEALASLARVRDAGHSRALVAVATGMGKTWLAAFDACQFGEEIGRRPRVLIIAHRAHILAQAEAVLSRLLDHQFGAGSTAWYIGNQSDLSSELVVASIQKLSRPEGVQRLAKQHFDYVIMDEVHHAHAPSYRRVLAQLDCDFALGLTATPERTDGVDVATIFDDNLAYHASIGEGIAEEALVPFHYVGIKDTVDFRQVPWRNGRFDLTELEQRVARSERMDRLWSTMEKHPADRTLVFCCSRRHAVFARDWLASQGVTAAAVFSGDGSDPYGDSLERLRTGELQALCVVDMFNEGLDIPAVDRVVMLRPTESKVIFLQQLGRGLRASDGKTRLLVIDFVGNHRIFAQRIIHLLSLQGSNNQWHSLKDWLNGKPADLPAGCLLDVEVDAKDMLKQFLPTGRNAGIEGYRAIRDDLGRRPTALEVFSRGFLPRTICAAEGSWFGFAEAEGDLDDTQRGVVAEFGDWLNTVETTSLNKSYKMVVLRVLLDSGQLFSGIDLYEFSKRCRRFMLNHEVLRRDLEGEKHAVDHEQASDLDWAEWWIKWPIGRWLDAQNNKVWFERNGDHFRFRIECGDHLKPSIESMTEELVDWRLAAYAKSRRLVKSDVGELAFEGKVSHTGGRPILFLPDKTKLSERPVGPILVTLPDGAKWEFKLVKVACNVAKPVGEKTNQLGDLLKQWFGPNAGLPGTNFHVRFESKSGEWQISPIGAEVQSTGEPEKPIQDYMDPVEPNVELASRYTTHAPVYDLSAAAGEWGPEGIPAEIGWIAVPNQSLSSGMFAARVTGRSMEPRIPSDSWCLFRPRPAGSREGKLLLVQVNTQTDPEDGGRYTVKRYHSVKQATEDGWEHQTIQLQPLNKDYQPIEISSDEAEDIRVVGEFVCVIEPVEQ
jgi:superfamily II DNA or RNA helicase/diadenosine tetraphosphate (Ap4A) HIT family hydrolase/HKD family nuclease/SOS-response transcriptional repressor LexA